MKKIFLFLSALFIICGCSQVPKVSKMVIRDGFYQAMRLGNDTSLFTPLAKGEVVISFDTLFNPDDYTKVVIDTNDYVPMELEQLPSIEQQTGLRKLLSISLTPAAAQKMRIFTANRVMKESVVVIDGKAITLHKIREAITGPGMQITRCDNNACEYLFVKMKNNVKH